VRRPEARVHPGFEPEQVGAGEAPQPDPPKHPPIVSMLKEMYADQARAEAEQRERDQQMSSSNTVFERTFHKCEP
jgi:hypothetical protein